MSKNKIDKELRSNIDDLLFSQTEIKNTQIKYKNKSNPSRTIAIRLKQDDIDKLTKHFKLKGFLNISTGIRQIIAKYMQDNNLL